jgi:hypothetical protein
VDSAPGARGLPSPVASAPAGQLLIRHRKGSRSRRVRERRAVAVACRTVEFRLDRSRSYREAGATGGPTDVSLAQHVDGDGACLCNARQLGRENRESTLPRR